MGSSSSSSKPAVVAVAVVFEAEPPLPLPPQTPQLLRHELSMYLGFFEHSPRCAQPGQSDWRSRQGAVASLVPPPAPADADDSFAVPFGLHFCFTASLPGAPKGTTWIHFVDDHFSPLRTGQDPCSESSSFLPFGFRE